METAAASRKRARGGDASSSFEQRKRVVAVHEAAAAGSADRLSDLPDYLLHDILSRLGSRQAQRTDVEQWRRFEDFADGLLPLHDASVALDRFRLHVAREVVSTNTGRWC
ncbi:hypothetical protein E2562_023206 [Oryza meyeriana var. granulata]|uniref:F-box domain-containing protein n=1 Tax=Oryza meyeriana var. granulata TaxID=110450 RepID=A0A6G1C0P5_9ORYZ|nr:hypothetical protein E2562_023206 [Oryza meyeriana var. granulata]